MNGHRSVEDALRLLYQAAARYRLVVLPGDDEEREAAEDLDFALRGALPRLAPSAPHGGLRRCPDYERCGQHGCEGCDEPITRRVRNDPDMGAGGACGEHGVYVGRVCPGCRATAPGTGAVCSPGVAESTTAAELVRALSLLRDFANVAGMGDHEEDAYDRARAAADVLVAANATLLEEQGDYVVMMHGKLKAAEAGRDAAVAGQARAREAHEVLAEAAREALDALMASHSERTSKQRRLAKERLAAVLAGGGGEQAEAAPDAPVPGAPDGKAEPS